MVVTAFSACCIFFSNQWKWIVGILIVICLLVILYVLYKRKQTQLQGNFSPLPSLIKYKKFFTDESQEPEPESQNQSSSTSTSTSQNNTTTTTTITTDTDTDTDISNINDNTVKDTEDTTDTLNAEDNDTNVKDSVGDNEVFNLSNNIYTYDDSKAVCEALDSRLATVQEVHDAYKEGASWCNYGWTEGQHALYPTQEETYDKLQQTDSHKQDCGDPGVNGGYFANKELKFGVNCYGKKPTRDKHNSAAVNGYFPDYISEEEQRLQDKVARFRQTVSEIEVLPFNRKTWDENRTIKEKVSDLFD